jgi:broad specificity phosphatase PhoE
MEVYFLRHGETPWNCEKKIQGSTGWIDLTDFGVELAERTRDGFKAAGISFDRVFASPLRRAFHTAQIVAEGFGMKPEPDARLREMCFGQYEGSLMGDGSFADDNIRACFKDPASFVPCGGESFDDVMARVRDFFDNVLSPLEGKVERVLAVSHGAFMRSVIRYVTGRPLKDYWQGVQPNCCVHVIEMSGGRSSVKSMSMTFGL